jgi:hypothetical protein
MADTPAPMPDHPMVRSLDKMFTGPGGNAPALAGWLEFLGTPKSPAHPRRVTMNTGDVLEERNEPIYPGNESILVMSQEPIRRDLGVDRFFAHANVLSGQRVGQADIKGQLQDVDLVGATFQLIEEVRYKKPKSMTSPREDSADVWSDIKAKIGPAIHAENWDSPSADVARLNFDNMLKWYDNHRNGGLLAMNWHLAKYSAVIIKARMDVNELMGTLVKALDEWYSHSLDADGVKFFISMFRKITDLALAPVTTAKDAIWGAYDIVTDAMGLAAKEKEASGFGYDPSDHAMGIYRMLELFIRTGNQICDEATKVIHVLVTDPNHGIQAVRNNWRGVPRW